MSTNRRAVFYFPDAFDFTRDTAVKKFLISGSEPVNSTRRIIFELDGNFVYFTDDGLSDYPADGLLDDVLLFGNTVEQLLAVDGIPQFVGKRVGLKVAMDAPDNLRVLPMLKIGAVVSSFNDIYEKDELSPIFELKTNKLARIVDVSAVKDLIGYADLQMSIRYRNEFGKWSDFVTFDDAAFKCANAVQFKASHSVTTLDGEESELVETLINYTTDAYHLAGDTLEFVTKPVEYYTDLAVCYALIKHSPLSDCDISAFIMFKDKPLKRNDLLIGKGSGSAKTYYLGTGGGVDQNVNHSSLVIKVDGQIVNDFTFDTQNSTVNINAASDSDITASYLFGADLEEWLPMTALSSTDDNGIVTSRFLRRADNKKAHTISAVRFSFTRKRGTVDEFTLATSNGKTQSFTLEHRANRENLIVKNADFTFDESAQKLKVTGSINTPIYLAYDWTGSFPAVYQLAAGWAV